MFLVNSDLDVDYNAHIYEVPVGIDSLTLTSTVDAGVTIGKAPYGYENNLYANGVPLTIGTHVSYEGSVYGGSHETPLECNTSIVVDEGAEVYAVYGGSHNASLVGNTSIIIKGTVASTVAGGGYASASSSSPNAVADVDGSTSIVIGQTGVTKHVYGAGRAEAPSSGSAPSSVQANVSGSATLQIAGATEQTNGGGFAGPISYAASVENAQATANLGGDVRIVFEATAISSENDWMNQAYGGGWAQGTKSKTNRIVADVAGSTYVEALGDDTASGSQPNIKAFNALYGGGWALYRNAQANVEGNTLVKTSRPNWESREGLAGGGLASWGATANVNGTSSVEVFGIAGQKANYENANLVVGGGVALCGVDSPLTYAQSGATKVVIHTGASLTSGSDSGANIIGGGYALSSNTNTDVAGSTSVIVEDGITIQMKVIGGGAVFPSGGGGGFEQEGTASANVKEANISVGESCRINQNVIGGGYIGRNTKNTTADTEVVRTTIGAKSTLASFFIGGSMVESSESNQASVAAIETTLQEGVTISNRFVGGSYLNNVKKAKADITGNVTTSIGNGSKISGNSATGGSLIWGATDSTSDIGGNVTTIVGDSVTTQSFAGGGMPYYGANLCSANVAGSITSKFGNNYIVSGGEFIGAGYVYYNTSSCIANAGRVETVLGNNASLKTIVGGGWTRSGSGDSADVDESASLTIGESAKILPTNLSSTWTSVVGAGRVESSPHSHANVGNNAKANAVEVHIGKGLSASRYYGAGYVQESNDTAPAQAQVNGNVISRLDGNLNDNSLSVFFGGSGVQASKSNKQGHADILGDVESTLTGFSFKRQSQEYDAPVVGAGVVFGTASPDPSQANVSGNVKTTLKNCSFEGKREGTDYEKRTACPTAGGRYGSDVNGDATLVFDNTMFINQDIYAEKYYAGWRGLIGGKIITQFVGTGTYDAIVDASRQSGDAEVLVGDGSENAAITLKGIHGGSGLSTNVLVNSGSSLSLSSAENSFPEYLDSIANLTIAQDATLTVEASTAQAKLSGNLSGAGTISLPAGGSLAGDGVLDGQLTLVINEDEAVAAAGQTYFDFSDASTGNVAFADPDKKLILKKDATTPSRVQWILQEIPDIIVSVEVLQDGQGTHGTVEPTDPQVFTGTPLEYTLKPDYGYRIGTVTVEGEPLTVTMQSDLRTGIVSYTPSATSTIHITFVPLDNKTADEIITKLPSVEDTDTPDEITKKTDTILDAKLDYESMPEEEKAAVEKDVVNKLNDALGSLPSVDIKVELSVGTDLQPNIDIPENQKSRFLGGVSKEDTEKLKEGAAKLLKVIVKVEDIDEPANPGEQDALNNSLGLYSAGQHFSASVTKQLYTDTAGTTLLKETPITKLPTSVQLTFKVPTSLLTSANDTTRYFTLTRTHFEDATWKVTFLRDEDGNETNESVTVSTDRFSTYSIVYQDKYTVTFMNGADVFATSQVAVNDTVAAPSPGPSNPGFIFGGWYATADCPGSAYDFTTPVTSPLMLYAKWITPVQPEPGEFLVMFEANGGAPVPAPQAVRDGSPAQEPEQPQKAGHQFGGWFRDSNLTEAWDFTTPVTDDMTLYAYWIPEEYDVTFEANGGEPAPAAQKVPYGQKIQPVEAPFLDGFTFVAWYVDAALTKPWDFDADLVKAPLTLYAKWEQNTVEPPAPVDPSEPTTPDTPVGPANPSTDTPHQESTQVGGEARPLAPTGDHVPFGVIVFATGTAALGCSAAWALRRRAKR